MNSMESPYDSLMSPQQVEDLRLHQTSSADTGSSQTISSGPIDEARAMPARWHCPPENSCGLRPSPFGIETDRG